MDVHKKNIVGATLFPGEVEPWIWTVPNKERPLKKMIGKIMTQAPDLVACCYEAGPCGFVVQRQVRSLGAECMVIAPSMTPRKSGDRVKTDRRDAKKLAEFFRSGILTEVVAPGTEEESVRALTRCRDQARSDLMRCRHRLTKFLDQRGIYYSEGSHWTQKHSRWLKTVTFEHEADRIVFLDYQLAVEYIAERMKTLDAKIKELSESAPYASAVGRLRCFRGIDTTTAMILITELYAFARFVKPGELMGFLGMIPSENSSGEQTRRGSITKAGNKHARRVLVETAHHYRNPPLVGVTLKKRRAGQPADAIAIADKAMTRLWRRYHYLTRRGKHANVALVAVARELLGFVWATLSAINVKGSAG
jgi:transposase